MNDKKPAPKRGNNKQQTHDYVADRAEQQRPGLAARLTAARLLGAVIEKNTSLDGLTDNSHGHPQYLARATRPFARSRYFGLGATQSR